MYDSITNALLKFSSHAKNILDDEALNLSQLYVVDFLKNLNMRNIDIYYLSFALMLCKILDIKFDLCDFKKYLKDVDFKNFDMPHLASLARCFYLLNLKSESLNLKISNIAADNPYDIFLKVAALQDCGLNPKNFCDLKILESMKSENGGYSNVRASSFSGVNASAAAIVAKLFLSNNIDYKTLDFLKASQEISGGFKAQKDSPVADLLTSASAGFALKLCGVNPKESLFDFSISHWISDGSFSATVLEIEGDCEYLFYGLLALGVGYA